MQHSPSPRKSILLSLPGSTRSAQLIQVTVQYTDLEHETSAAVLALDQLQVMALQITRCLCCAEVMVSGLVRAQAAAIAELERRLHLVEDMTSRIRCEENDRERALYNKRKPQQLCRQPLQVMSLLMSSKPNFAIVV